MEKKKNEKLKLDCEYDEWVKEFKKSEKWKGILIEINKISNGHEVSKKEWLRREVLWLCFQTSNYDESKDQYALKDLNAKDGKKRLKSAVNALERVIEFNQGYERQAEYACIDVANLMVEKKISVEDEISIRELVHGFFKSYKAGLERSLEGPSEDSVWLVGGLFYPSIKLDGKPYRKPKDIKKSSFFIHLVNIFRRYTADKPDLGWAGEPLPEYGDPCYSSVAGISSIILDLSESLGSDDVKKTVDRLIAAGVKLHSWKLPSRKT